MGGKRITRPPSTALDAAVLRFPSFLDRRATINLGSGSAMGFTAVTAQRMCFAAGTAGSVIFASCRPIFKLRARGRMRSRVETGHVWRAEPDHGIDRHVSGSISKLRF